MTKRTFDDLKAAVEEMNVKFPRPGIIPGLVVSEVYDLEVHWPKPYAFSGPGVYALIDDTWEVAYVGKASFCQEVAGRLGAHFCYGPDRRAQIKVAQWINERIRYIVAVCVPAEHAFEAGAIEEFLIHRLQPRLNGVGIRRGEVTSVEPPCSP